MSEIPELIKKIRKGYYANGGRTGFLYEGCTCPGDMHDPKATFCNSLQPEFDWDDIEALLSTAERVDKALKDALHLWVWAMPQELFAHNKANRDKYDELSLLAGGKPMELGRTPAEYEGKCAEFDELRAGVTVEKVHDKATCPECQPYPEGRGGTVYPECDIARHERRARWVEEVLGRRGRRGQIL